MNLPHADQIVADVDDHQYKMCKFRHYCMLQLPFSFDYITAINQ